MFDIREVTPANDRQRKNIIDKTRPKVFNVANKTGILKINKEI
jgi:hypothetical protein